MGSDQAATPSHQAGLESPEYCIPAGTVQGQFKAMGTTITTLLPAERADAIEIVRSLVAGWEQVLSRLLPESELSWLNAHPDQNIITRPLFYNVLTTVLNAAQATRGINDPTLHDQIVKIGYDRSFDKLSSALPASTYDGLPGRAGAVSGCRRTCAASGYLKGSSWISARSRKVWRGCRADSVAAGGYRACASECRRRPDCVRLAADVGGLAHCRSGQGGIQDNPAAQRSHGGFWHYTQALDARRRSASPSARPAHWLARRQ